MTEGVWVYSYDRKGMGILFMGMGVLHCIGTGIHYVDILYIRIWM